MFAVVQASNMLLLLFYLFTLVTPTEEQVISCYGGICPSGLDCISLPEGLQCVDPCYHHSVLNDTWRSVDNTDSTVLQCDSSLSAGWYRLFLGQSNAHVPEACVASGRCGTHGSMWITEPHPTQLNEIVTRSVCGSWLNKCCYGSAPPIQIKLCYGYYVYKLTKPGSCYYTYCAESNPPNPEGFRVSGQTGSIITLQWNKVNNNVSFVLLFDGTEINISAPVGDGPVSHNVSCPSAGTNYTVTLHSVFENIRSSGISIIANSDPQNPKQGTSPPPPADTNPVQAEPSYVFGMSAHVQSHTQLSPAQMEMLLEEVFRQKDLPSKSSVKVRSVKRSEL